MRILVVTPAGPDSRSGNRVTALRWARLLTELGHTAPVVERFEGQQADVVLALHARRSAPSVQRVRRERPLLPVIVALTGTDLYQDLPDDPDARRSLELADRLVVLQRLAARRVPESLRDRVRVVYQSAPAPPNGAAPATDGFPVAVLAHLREIKDPLRTAAAARLLPASSAVRVVHAGAVLDASLAGAAEQEARENPRYEWRGELSHEQALTLLSGSRLLAVTSTSEGGANVVSEALTAGVPVVSSRNDGAMGILGEDYPGLFPVGDAAALAELLRAAETDDGGLYTALQAHCARVAGLVTEQRERQALADLADELSQPPR